MVLAKKLVYIVKPPAKKLKYTWQYKNISCWSCETPSTIIHFMNLIHYGKLYSSSSSCDEQSNLNQFYVKPTFKWKRWKVWIFLSF